GAWVPEDNAVHGNLGGLLTCCVHKMSTPDERASEVNRRRLSGVEIAFCYCDARPAAAVIVRAVVHPRLDCIVRPAGVGSSCIICVVCGAEVLDEDTLSPDTWHDSGFHLILVCAVRNSHLRDQRAHVI